tara:strand:- start:314 stop:586 length:273 start_codon:yes stop_codon:yes gene_type:complete
MKKLHNPALAGNAFAMPLVVAEGRINSEHSWRLELKAFGDQHCFDFRRWHSPQGEEPRPSRKGLMLSTQHLPEIAAAFADAAAIVDPGEP